MKRLVLAMLLSAHTLLADEATGHWAITAELKIVSIPPELALTLVSQLQAPATEAAAQTQLRTLLQEGRAKVVDWTRLETTNNVRAKLATGTKMQEGIEWEAPRIPAPMPPTPFTEHLCPVTLETHELGVEFEFEPTVQQDGKFITVNLAASERRLIGWDRTLPTFTRAGVQISRGVPRMSLHRTAHRLLAPNGQWMVSGTFRSNYPKKTFAVHLVRFTARRVEAR